MTHPKDDPRFPVEAAAESARVAAESVDRFDVSADKFRAYSPNKPVDNVNQVIMDLEEGLQVARKGEWEASQQHGYWYRRCQFAEAALEPFAARYDEIKAQEARMPFPTYSVDTKALCDAATVLDSNRRDEEPGANFEDYIRNRRQTKVLAWAERTFGGMDGLSVSALDERAFRFLEEALELTQAALAREALRDPDIQHHTFMDALEAGRRKIGKLVSRVWSRPVNDACEQEVGGVMVTLNSLAEVLGISISRAEKDEFARVLSVPREAFQERHKAKQDEGL